MSVESITWALRVPVPASSAKFVLVVLANQANDETGRSFPSIKYLSEATGQDRKTVISNIAKLIGWGLIEDSGERMGKTKQVIVYRLLRGPDLFVEQSQKRDSPKNGTVPEKDWNSTVFPLKQSQKRDTEPSINHQEPEKQKPVQRADRFADWFAIYPKRVARKKAEEIWRRRGLDPMADTLVADVLNRVANDDQWKRGFAPHPTTYLNQDRWTDEVQVAKPALSREAAPSKTMQGLMALEDMKRGLVRTGNSDGAAKTAMPLLGSDSGS